MKARINYWRRIFNAYVLNKSSQLTFWHNNPKESKGIILNELGLYYMMFYEKADYDGLLDINGIPMLNYHGEIGQQYNPIAIAQWGLGNFNKWILQKDLDSKNKFIKCADWLVENVVKNDFGIFVWMHNFDFEYRDTLKKPWYSGLAQGQAISVLVRAHKLTKDDKYKRVAKLAIKSFETSIYEGGVVYVDKSSFKWIEEYIVEPPTHILNGFIWSVWGVYDFAIYFKEKKYFDLFKEFKKTLSEKLNTFDTGYWSKYEHSGTFISMIASSFYHKLHIVQLKILYNLTKDEVFNFYSNKWLKYQGNYLFRKIALIQKVFFKVFYY